MQRINLRDYYPDYYKTDYIIEVPDEVADAMRQSERDERAYRRRVYYHHAQYSLDLADGIENDAVFRVESPDELYERKLTAEQLYAAIASLPEVQAQRIYARYVLNLTLKEIAEQENISIPAIHYSILVGLREIKRYLQNLE